MAMTSDRLYFYFCFYTNENTIAITGYVRGAFFTIGPSWHETTGSVFREIKILTFQKKQFDIETTHPYYNPKVK